MTSVIFHCRLSPSSPSTSSSSSASPSPGEIFTRVVDCVRQFTVEANLNCTRSGIQIQATDDSHTSLVIAELTAEGFEEYACERLCIIGVNLTSLAKILSHVGPTDAIDLTVTEPMEFLELTITHGSSRRQTSEYQLHVIDIDADHMAAPEDRAPVIVAMPSEEFARLCQAYSELSPGLVIDVQPDAIRFCTEVMASAAAVGQLLADLNSSGTVTGGPVVGNGVTCLKFAATPTPPSRQQRSPTSRITNGRSRSGASGTKSNMSPYLIELQEPCRVNVAISFLLAVAKARVLSSEVRISLSEGNPIQLEYALPNPQSGGLKYFVAPKVV